MNSEIFDIFPLSVFRDKILLSANEKKDVVDYVFSMENDTDNSKIIIDAFEDKITSYFLLYNSGFSYANNYGINKSSGEYILLLNPDTYLQNNAILDMIDYLDANKHVGVMGPLFINTQGIEYLPYSIYPNIRQQIFETFFIKKWLKKIERTKIQQA